MINNIFFSLIGIKLNYICCKIVGGGFKNVLVIGAEVISRYLDWTDRETCILFGDAAGAVLLQVICSLTFCDLVKSDIQTNIFD